MATNIPNNFWSGKWPQIMAKSMTCETCAALYVNAKERPIQKNYLYWYDCWQCSDCLKYALVRNSLCQTFEGPKREFFLECYSSLVLFRKRYYALNLVYPKDELFQGIAPIHPVLWDESQENKAQCDTCVEFYQLAKEWPVILKHSVHMFCPKCKHYLLVKFIDTSFTYGSEYSLEKFTDVNDFYATLYSYGEVHPANRYTNITEKDWMCSNDKMEIGCIPHLV